MWKQQVPCLGNMLVAGFCRPPNKPMADLTHHITGALDLRNSFRAIFTGDLNVVVVNHSNVARNHTDVFHLCRFVNKINLPIFISPSDGNATSSMDHTWHNLKSCSLRRSYVALPALSNPYASSVNFKGRHAAC